MPPARDLGPVVAVWAGSVKAMFAGLAVGLAGTAFLGAFAADTSLGLASFIGTFTVLGYMVALCMRRWYWAVGTDWVYVRRSSFRRGRWAPLSQITSVSIVTVSNSPYLRVRAGRHKIFDARTGSGWASKSPFFPALGQALLQLPLPLDDPTRHALTQWADFSLSTPTPEAH